MRRSAVLLVVLLAACSSGTPKAADTSPTASTTPGPTASASASPAAVTSPAPTTARVTPSPTRSPAAARTPSPSAKPRRTQAPSPAPKPTPSPTRVGQTFKIDEVAPDRFSPRALTIRVGDSVLVTNEDVTSHTFTVPSLNKDSGNMDSGDTYRLRFARAGTFDFVCTYHEDVGMTGRVTVKP